MIRRPWKNETPRRAVAILGFTALLLAASSSMQDNPVARDPEPRWWRGNLHTHTLWSDGDGFPEVIAEWYRDHGYHFLALSDHNVLSQGERWMPVSSIDKRAGVDAFDRYQKRYGNHWVQSRGERAQGNLEVRLKTLQEVRSLVDERNRFLMLQSEEITGAAADGHSLHMNATNIGERLPFLAGSTVRESMTRNLQAVEDSAARTGRDVMLHVNHPNYKWGVTAEDLAAVINERFFEVWNGVDGDDDPGDRIRPDTDMIWDIANTLRIVRYGAAPLYGLGTDDSHNHHGNKTHSPPGRAWVMVLARYLSPATLLQAMRMGDFYATTGVVLEDVAFDGKARKLSLRIRAQSNESFVTRFIGTRKGAPVHGKPRLDANGHPMDTTLDYRTNSGPQIGEVLAEAKGLTPSYQLRGDELYVRAVVTSTGAPEVPSNEYPTKRAWTQPVGWQKD